MVTNPIWKDTYYTTTADTAVYRIELNGQNIYSGKAVKYPNADDLDININRICNNYLSSDIAPLLEMMPATDYRILNIDAVRTFNLYVDDVNVEDYTFRLDYSYED